MTTIHNLGFPRIGTKRELKFALKSYWRGESSRDALKALGAELRQRSRAAQQELDWVPVGDFAFYDLVLNMSFTLGNLPERVQASKAIRWTTTFAWPVAVRRSLSNSAAPAKPIAALAR